MAITDLSELINLRTSASAEDIWVGIDGRVGASAATAPVAGRYVSLWQYNKTRGGSGAAPSTARALTRTTQGALAQNAVGGGATKYLTGAVAVWNTAGSVLVYDRLVDSGGLSGTVTTAQTTNLPTSTLPRYTDGLGNFIFLEITGIIGTTATTATISYKDTNGDTRTTPAFAIGGTGLREAQRFIRVPLDDAYANLGVTTIENLDLVASTTTAGGIAVGIGHEIALLPTPGAGGCQPMDFISGAQILPEIGDDCIAFAFQGPLTSVPILDIGLFFCEKS
jgi:hypothetical protein